MNKQAFLTQLRQNLSDLPPEELEERLLFYSEMIDDRMEQDGVFDLADTDELTAQILADLPPSQPVKDKRPQKNKRKTREIILLAVGSPLWFPLLIAAIAVLFSLYVTVWSLVISLWSVFVSLAAVALWGIVAGLTIGGDGLTALAMIGVGLVCAGLSIFMFNGCKAATKGLVIRTKRLAKRIKNYFVKKEEAA